MNRQKRLKIKTSNESPPEPSAARMTPDVLPELWAIWVCDSTGGFWLLAGDDGPEGIKCYKSEELAKEALQWEIEGGYIQTRHGEVGKIIRIK